MAHVQQRRALSGPALIRLLARLADTDLSQPGQSLSDRLSQWLSWTDAITLSTALNASLPTVAPGAQAAGADAATLCGRVRSALAKAIGATGLSDTRSNSGARPPAQSAPVAVDVDFADFRQRYVSMQQTMETEIGSLRGRLRRALAAKAPDLARLAMLDASMEQALAGRERTLLGAIPTLLGQYFERLRAAELQRQADPLADSTAPAPSSAWLNAFRNDMQSVLLAELDVRFQPVEGLLAALGPR
ncbi:hypothetical protein LMG7141_00922 [Ralstonia condita]|jgi:hypothetical protein|uniref:DUF3348 domain-containing protein n=1 Tax=Ralstonia condita TaxID=3058600 RepID=A0ABM9J1W7_9RALS|nr:DUF3348 domain-containing protein [Ralstonia sp. LMG 7141]MDE2204827.1 DUF3348 domain-containing protein [Burkholderiaceae bacterium]CAJ0779723.1 hypothetical protein LMG7141_00922 [Ralstonia sp. LMG 7141]